MHGRARERWGEWSTEAIGNHLSPVIISHLSAVLEEHPDGLGGSHVQLTDKQTDRKGPDVTPVPRKYQRTLKALAAQHLLWGLAAIRTWVLASCPVCQASPYPQILKNTDLVTLKMCKLLKNPQAPRKHLFGSSLKNPPGGWGFWVLSGFVNTS